jgi:hypothetical protein
VYHLGASSSPSPLADPAPNQALEPTPYSVRCAPAFGRGSPRALDAGAWKKKPGVSSHTTAALSHHAGQSRSAGRVCRRHGRLGTRGTAAPPEERWGG